MPDPIPMRTRPILLVRTSAGAAPSRAPGPTRGLGSARPHAYRHQPISPLRWHARWPRPHPLAWAIFGCVVFWWAVICAVRF